ncbi:MAG: hypothetical protein V4638_04660 [Bacteroidota bacterium]
MRNLLLICCIFASNVALSQETFSNNREKFVKEFQKSIAEYGKGDFKQFTNVDLPAALIEANEISEAYFTQMVTTCNLMVTKKLKPYPEIYQYVFSVYSLVHGKQSDESFKAWHSSVDKMLDSRNIKKIEDFLDLSSGFFSERRIAESSNFKWFYTGGTYSFEFTDKAFIKLNNGNLICRIENPNPEKRESKYIDSILVSNTTGTFDPTTKKWEGENGVLTWEKVGLPKNEANATLKKYNVSCKTPNLTADTVSLTSKYFTKPILGSLSDRAFKSNREDDKIYPQFLSYEKRLKIKNIVPDVDYDGGFAMNGATFVGQGTVQQPSTITYFRNQKPFIKASAQIIDISAKRIFINNARTAIYLNTGDSITHPGLLFKYDLEKQIVEFSRTKTGNGQAPISDSYHKLDMYLPMITWNVKEDFLLYTYESGTSQEQRIAKFESQSYFDARLYDQLQGLAPIHPLVAIHQYSYKHDEYVLPEGKAATALNLSLEQAKPILLDLSTYGFISYDTEAKTVTINKKTENFVYAKTGKRDYDNIIFVSDFRPKELKGFTEEQIAADPNLQALKVKYKQQNEERRLKPSFGKMSFGTLEMNLAAVDLVTISNLQNTTVFPTGSDVVIKENRNFEFNGWINSGKLEINSLAANYNYKENKFNLFKTDQTTIRVNPMDKTHGAKPISMVTDIKGISGELFIDDPLNRSGQNSKISNFPILKTSKEAKVYYNDKQLYRGAYDSSRFFYTILPFTLDSLDNFNDLALRFKGSLNSAGIFPKINEDLKIMADYSFGFSSQAPAEGYEFYGMDAKYKNKIVLSSNGLQGAGEINFVNSTSISKALTFLPDSAVGYASFINRPTEGAVQFPDVESPEAYIVYLPKMNKLKAESTPKSDLLFFSKEAKLRGSAIVTPKGMEGNGIMLFNTATTVSAKYTYKRWDIDADTSTFNLKNADFESKEEDPLAFIADNVKAHISFKDRAGKFLSNKGTSQLNFPVNKYICKMDQFSWFMDNSELQLEANNEKGSEVDIKQDLDLVGPNFFSIHPDQDSLQFRSPLAKYDLKKKTIFCDKVEFIEVADARIYPDSMKVVVRKNAAMDQFLNAKVVANFVTKYHTFTNSTIDIQGRRKYKGLGEYRYIDKDSSITVIQMKSIGVDTSYQTIAKGEISDVQGFKLSKEFDYYGKIAINAANPLIFFDGATRIDHNCEKFERNWLSFKSYINPKSIQIPVDKDMKSLTGESVSAGIVWRNANSPDSIRLYPTFLSKLTSQNDIVAMTSSGLLQFDYNAKEYQIASKEKLLNRNEKGNFIALHTESCSMNGMGVISLGLDLGENSVDMVGVVNYDQTKGETSMNVTARFNLPVDKGLMEKTADRINAIPDLKMMEMNSNTLEMALVEWTNQETADKFKSDYTIKGEIKKFPEQLEQAFVLTDLRLVSFDYQNLEEKGLISSSPSAVLLNMYGTPVMKYIPVQTFFQQTGPEGMADRYGVYLNAPGLDYYFDYKMAKKEAEMNIISGDPEFNTEITAIKEEKRKSKNFKYQGTSQRIYLSRFLGLFER